MCLIIYPQRTMDYGRSLERKEELCNYELKHKRCGNICMIYWYGVKQGIEPLIRYVSMCVLKWVNITIHLHRKYVKICTLLNVTIRMIGLRVWGRGRLPSLFIMCTLLCTFSLILLDALIKTHKNSSQGFRNIIHTHGQSCGNF